MKFVPSLQQHHLSFRHDPQSLAQIASLEAVVPDQFGLPVRTGQIDLGVAITDHMDMRGLMVIHEDDEAQPGVAMHRDHCGN
jgi:hypothetical protein